MVRLQSSGTEFVRMPRLDRRLYSRYLVLRASFAVLLKQRRIAVDELSSHTRLFAGSRDRKLEYNDAGEA